jgi:hypothetical protein
MKRCIRYQGWRCPHSKEADTTYTMLEDGYCSSCSRGEIIAINEIDNLYCPICREDIKTPEVDTGIPSNQQFSCPHCQAKLKIKISVEVEED